MLRTFIILVVWLTCTISVAFAGTTVGPLHENTIWSGDVKISGRVEVPPGVELRLSAGTHVQFLSSEAELGILGVLVVEGDESHPVTFTGSKGAKGVVFTETARGDILHAEFTGFDLAVSAGGEQLSVQDSSFSSCINAVRIQRGVMANLQHNIFTANQIAISIEMRSSPTISDNTFSDNTKYAVFIGHGSSARIERNHFLRNAVALVMLRNNTGQVRGNTFASNEIGINAVQSGGTIDISGNAFVENQTSILGESYTYPDIVNNRFLRNGTAIEGRQYYSGTILHNAFEQNGMSLKLNKRSFPEVIENVFIGGELAFFIDYSSYPRVNRNNFISQQEAVRLGDHQSADWEERRGSSALVFKDRNQKRAAQTSMAPEDVPISEEIDFSQNWWGAEASGMHNIASDNPSLFYDREDNAYLTFAASGDEKFMRDIVKYTPWAAEPIIGAGPGE